MPELTRPPKTAREWLENVRSRGGMDGEWAHIILSSIRESRYGRNILDEPQAPVPAPTGDAI